MARLVRVERWSDRESNSGARLDVCRVDQVIDPEEYLELSGREELTFGLDPDHPWVTALTIRQVVRPVYEDTAGSLTYDEWRVWSLTPARRKNSARDFTVFCRSIKFDLGAELATFTQANGVVFHHHEFGDLAPTDFVDALIASDNWPADFVKGTVDPAAKYFFVLDWETHLSALTEAAVTTTGAELSVLRNGTSEYVVALLDEIRAGEAAEIRFANNAIESEVERDYTESGTLIYPKGEGPQGEAPTIAGMRFFASPREATPTTLWTLYPWDGRGDSAGVDLLVCTEDDQFNGFYLEHRRGVYTGLVIYEITDSALADSGKAIDVTLDTAVTSVGLPWMRVNADGDDLTHIPVPSKVAVYGRKAKIIEREDIPGVTNLLAEPFALGTEGTHWDAIGGAVVTTVASPDPRVHFGDTATKVTADTGEGLTRYVGSLIYSSADNPHLSFQVQGHLEAGAVKLEVYLQWTPLFGTPREYTFPYGTNVDGTPVQASISQPESPFHMTIEPQLFNFAFADAFIQEVGTITAFEIRLTALADSTVFYVDAYQVVNSVVIGPKIVSGASAAKLWDAGCRAILSGASDPKARLRTTALDFNRLGENPLTGALYPYDQMLPGVTARVVDPGIGLDDSRRIRSVRRKLKVEAITALELMEAEVVA